MVRPTLTLEKLVIRPGYAEAISLLVGEFRTNGATIPELSEKLRSRLGKPPHVVGVWLNHRLKALEKARLVEYVPFAPEYKRAERLKGAKLRGRAPSGKWKLTGYGAAYWEARLSIEIAKGMAGRILGTPDSAKHVTAVGTPTVLLVNCGPIREDHIGRRRLTENPGPTLGFVRPAQAVALEIWSQKPEVAREWKSLKTLQAKHPPDRATQYSVPEWLAMKDWVPAVRRAHRKLERHRVVFCLEVNPAYWDALPIDRLEQMTAEYVSHKAAFLARRKAWERSQREKAKNPG